MANGLGHPMYGSGIGSTGDYRSMAQYLRDRILSGARTATLGELRELAQALQMNGRRMGFSDQELGEMLMVINQASGGQTPAYAPGAPAAPAAPAAIPGAPPGATAPVTPVAGQALPVPPRTRAPGTGMELSPEMPHRRLAPDRFRGLQTPRGGQAPQAAPLGPRFTTAREQSPFVMPGPGGEGALPDPMGPQAPAREQPPAIPPPDQQPPPKPKGPEKATDYAGMTMKDFIEMQGDVLYISINGHGLRNEGGRFVPAR